MTAAAAPPPWISRVSWVDVAVTATIFLAASVLLIPAVSGSRFQARLAVCQDNLRDLGMALTQFSEVNHAYFPRVPTQGKLAQAGIYAPILQDSGLLLDARRVVCPSSELAEFDSFRIPSVKELETAPPGDLDNLSRALGGSYGYNLGHMEKGTYHDTKNLRRDYFGLMADVPDPLQPGRQSTNHGGCGQNILFEDGHVRFIAAPRLTGCFDDFFSNDAGVMAAGVHLNDSVIVPGNTPPIIYLNNHN
jgi:hypothetical protein